MSDWTGFWILVAVIVLVVGAAPRVDCAILKITNACGDLGSHYQSK